MRHLGPKALLTYLLCLAPLVPLGSGCDGDDEAEAGPDAGVLAEDLGAEAGADENDTGDGSVGDAATEEPPAHFFAFGTAPGQPISDAPFPNDLYLRPDGTIGLAPLHEDPRLGQLGGASTLERFTALAAQRTGFGSTAVVWFPTASAPGMASTEGRVRLITLAGPEAGREVAVQTLYSSAFGALGVFPAWGDYLMPGSTYGVVVTRGVLGADGAEVAPHPAVTALLDGDSSLAPDPLLHPRFAPLRAWLAAEAVDPGDVLVATVFTTEEVLPYARALFQAVDGFPLLPPTRRVRWDLAAERFEEAPPIEGAGLEDYYGVPEAPFEHNPGMWDWNRDAAESLDGYGRRYGGGTAHPGIGLVQHGSIIVPAFNMERGQRGQVHAAPLRFADGLPATDVSALVPFTLYLCEDHLADPCNLPVAIFSHGGSAIRADAAAWASANCLAGVATIAMDMVFHGGRTVTRLLEEQALIVPVGPDRENVFTGLREGDPGFARDWIGDRASSLDIVGALFAISQQMDPAIVEANMLTVSADTATLLRQVQAGDWSGVHAGLSFDSARIFHESLSFGTAFHTPLLALSDGFAGVVGSVGTGLMLSVNLLMAPSNSETATSVAVTVLGLRTPPGRLAEQSIEDPILGLHQWLHERGDSMPYAPYLLRHRPHAPRPPVLHSGDSWDETLYGPAQVSYVRALGLPLYEHGAEWTIDSTLPGAASLGGTPAPVQPLSGNVTFGGQATTAAIFWNAGSCHALAHNAICVEHYAHPYPPRQPLAEPRSRPSPLCALHNQIAGFLSSILSGGPAEIGPPQGSCEEVYGGAR